MRVDVDVPLEVRVVRASVVHDSRRALSTIWIAALKVSFSWE